MNSMGGITLVVVVVVAAAAIIIIIIIIIISCHRPFLPGTSLEPTVIPTAQTSGLRQQYCP
jgi:hypothetical protein